MTNTTSNNQKVLDLCRNPHDHFRKWASYKGHIWWGEKSKSGGESGTGVKLYDNLHPNDDMWRVMKIWQGLGLIYMINTPYEYKSRYIRTKPKHPLRVMLTPKGDEQARAVWEFYQL